jgi:hypothetical protein
MGCWGVQWVFQEMERRTTMRHDSPIATFNAIYPNFLPADADAATQLAAAHRSSDEQVRPATCFSPCLRVRQCTTS